MELNVLGLPAKEGAVVGSEEELMPHKVRDVRARLPPFEPFSPMSTGSKGDTRLKVRLARLQMEAQEKAQTEMDLRLQT